MSVKNLEDLQFEVRWNGRLLELQRVARGSTLGLAGAQLSVVTDGIVVDGVRRSFAQGDVLGLTCGALDVVVSAPDRLRPSRSFDVDIGWWRSAAMALLIVMGAVLALRLTPSVASVDDGDLGTSRMRAARAAITPQPRPTPQASRVQQAPAPARKAASRATLTKVVSLADKRSRDLEAAKKALSDLGLGSVAVDNVFGGAASAHVDALLSGLAAPATAGLGGGGPRSTGAGTGGPSVGIGVLGTGSSHQGPDGNVALTTRPHTGPVVSSGGTVQYVGSLDRGEIQRVVDRAMARLRYCYEKALNGDQNLEGKLTAQWVIGNSGAVMSTSKLQSTLGNNDVDECVLRVIRQLKFPSPRGGGVVSVTYPFVFSAR